MNTDKPMVPESMVSAAMVATYKGAPVTDMLRGGGDEETAIIRTIIAAALRAEQAVGDARQSEGAVLVPREPTEAMFAAALPLHQRMGQFKLTMIWNAMIAAAPGGEGEPGNAFAYMRAVNRAETAELNAGRYLKLRESSGLVAGMNGGVAMALGTWTKDESDKEALDAAIDAMPATQPERDGRGT